MLRGTSPSCQLAGEGFTLKAKALVSGAAGAAAELSADRVGRVRSGVVRHQGITRDNLPRFHRLDDGIFGFFGHTDRGIAPGTAFARFMAAWLRGDRTDADLPLQPTAPQPARFAGLHSAL